MGNVFFERFSELCKAHGETPNSVAKEIGSSSGSVTAWKKGTEPRNATMTKIADYFDTTVDYLTGRTDDPENSERFVLECSADGQKETPPFPNEREKQGNENRNLIRIAGRDGFYQEHYLSDGQLAAIKAILDQLPDASDDL